MGAHEGYVSGENREINLDERHNSTHNASSGRVMLGEIQVTNINTGQGFFSNMHNSGPLNDMKLRKHQNHQLKQKQRRLVQGTLPFST